MILFSSWNLNGEQFLHVHSIDEFQANETDRRCINLQMAFDNGSYSSQRRIGNHVTSLDEKVLVKGNINLWK